MTAKVASTIHDAWFASISYMVGISLADILTIHDAWFASIPYMVGISLADILK
jgi:hypothetical protein